MADSLSKTQEGILHDLLAFVSALDSFGDPVSQSTYDMGLHQHTRDTKAEARTVNNVQCSNSPFFRFLGCKCFGKLCSTYMHL